MFSEAAREQPAHTVTVSIRDAQHSGADRAWIRERYPEYVEDLSRMSTNARRSPAGLFPPTGEFGESRTQLPAAWFADGNSHPLIILQDERPVGFALVSRPSRARFAHSPREQVDYKMAEFFIVREGRRRGVGRDAARLIFNRFAGRWQITEFQQNQAAVAFWRSIVSEYTGGRYREAVLYGEVHQFFTSRHAGAR